MTKRTRIAAIVFAGLMSGLLTGPVVAQMSQRSHSPDCESNSVEAFIESASNLGSCGLSADLGDL